MGDLIFCLNVYREEEMLQDCIDSIRLSNPDSKIVAVDGAYQSLVDETKKLIATQGTHGHQELINQFMPFIKAESDDATLEILERNKVDKIIKCELDSEGYSKPWVHEFVKRSKYFVGKPGDYYFVLDGDERVRGKIDFSALVETSYNIMLTRDDGTPEYRVMRLHKHVDGMEYRGAHHALYVNEELYYRDKCKTYEGARIDHLQTQRLKRDPIRCYVKGAYYRYLSNVEESAFRSQHHI